MDIEAKENLNCPGAQVALIHSVCPIFQTNYFAMMDGVMDCMQVITKVDSKIFAGQRMWLFVKHSFQGLSAVVFLF